MTPAGRPLILVVEDDPSLRRVTCRLLVNRGFATVEATSAPEALQALETLAGEVRLVLSDVVMPGMSGGELAAAVHRNWPDLPMLLMSGFHEDPHVGDLDAAGVPLLAKPFSGDDLERAVRARLAPHDADPHDPPAPGPGAAT